MTRGRTTSLEELQGWFAGRIPGDWFVGAPEVSADRDEILVVGTLAEPELPGDATAETKAAALAYLQQGEQVAVDAIPSIQKAVLASEDFKEGIQSFVERREARFQGR